MAFDFDDDLDYEKAIDESFRNQKWRQGIWILCG